MDALLKSISRAAKVGDAADADFEFHLCVAEASGNHYFPDLLRHLGAASSRARASTARRSPGSTGPSTCAR